MYLCWFMVRFDASKTVRVRVTVRVDVFLKLIQLKLN